MGTDSIGHRFQGQLGIQVGLVGLVFQRLQVDQQVQQVQVLLGRLQWLVDRAVQRVQGLLNILSVKIFLKIILKKFSTLEKF